MLSGFPPNAINVYVIEDVLIDAATRHAGRRILRQIKNRGITAHALTHAHADHQGASHEICTELDIPLWCGENDADAMENGNIMDAQPPHPLNNLIGAVWPGPPHPVARRLREGDDVAGFKVIDVPGHSAGHVAYWRESDGVLILGDVLNSMNLITAVPGLREPPSFFTPDPAQNRASARKLAALEPKLVLFGHGPPVRDTRKFVEFVAQLPD
jgi:glyoxylase-like metal-dependent hydrolase (beta-lactamase superfamily II)